MAQWVKNLPAMQDTTCSAGDSGLISGLGRSPGEGNGNALQENTMDREAWWAIVHGVARVGHYLVTKPPPFLKSLLNLLQYCFCFMFWFFDHEACGILAPQPGIEPTSPVLEEKVLTTGSSATSLYILYH